jgi:hypothetical protein
VGAPGGGSLVSKRSAAWEGTAGARGVPLLLLSCWEDNAEGSRDRGRARRRAVTAIPLLVTYVRVWVAAGPVKGAPWRGVGGRQDRTAHGAGMRGVEGGHCVTGPWSPPGGAPQARSAGSRDGKMLREAGSILYGTLHWGAHTERFRPGSGSRASSVRLAHSV